MLKIKNDAFVCVALGLVAIFALLGFGVKMCDSQCMEIARTVITSFIAIVAAYIAYKQYETNNQKLLLDLYDKRSKIYGEIKIILSLIGQQQNISYTKSLEFYRATADADFLLDTEIVKYIDEIYKRSINYAYQNDTLQRHRDDSMEYQKLASEILDQKIWFSEQHEVAKQMFQKYLSFKHLSHE